MPTRVLAASMEESTSTPSPRLMVLMFTDLVGSTALKHEAGVEAYRTMLQRHDALLRQALSLAGRSGRVLQDTGDGYFLAFDSAGQAVSAALLFQWFMHTADWP